jgi:hypothetical protein
MATEISSPPPATKPSALAERGEARLLRQRATAAAPPPGEEQAVSWGDWFVTRFWFACFVLLGLQLALDFISGLVRK